MADKNGGKKARQEQLRSTGVVEFSHFRVGSALAPMLAPATVLMVIGINPANSVTWIHSP